MLVGFSCIIARTNLGGSTVAGRSSRTIKHWRPDVLLLALRTNLMSVLAACCLPARHGDIVTSCSSNLVRGAPAFHQPSSVTPLSSNTTSGDVNTSVAFTSHLN
ncbi:uncharacterized protein [Dermacentor albipictus]|uniref:uncharacterized protein n=1 Tax=Dermacentor albipictus TaxID=60249 RepID=UPI0031FCA8E0